MKTGNPGHKEGLVMSLEKSRWSRVLMDESYVLLLQRAVTSSGTGLPTNRGCKDETELSEGSALDPKRKVAQPRKPRRWRNLRQQPSSCRRCWTTSADRIRT